MRPSAHSAHRSIALSATDCPPPSDCWGFAIVLVVNALVLPHSSEKELREILVISLEHISTFSHLIGKTYSLEISDEERVARDNLNQSIRADMGVLAQRYGQAGLEINYTRWKMKDYGFMVAKVRAMQHGLITSYSSLASMEKFDTAALDIVKKELQDTHASKAFSKLRRSTSLSPSAVRTSLSRQTATGADLAFSDIVAELAVGKVVYHSPAPGERTWEDFHDAPESPDLESGTGRGRRFSLSVPGPSHKEESDALQQRIAARLRKEVATAGSTPTTSRRPSVSTAPDTLVEGDVASAAAAALTSQQDGKRGGKIVDKVAFLRGAWRAFEESQLAGIGRLLATGVPDDDELRLTRPGPSMAEQYQNPPPRLNAGILQAATTATQAPELTKRATKGTDSSSEDEKVPAVPAMSEGTSRSNDTVRTAEMICGSAVMRSFAFLAGMGAVGGELAELCVVVVLVLRCWDDTADAPSVVQVRVCRPTSGRCASQEGDPFSPVRVKALVQGGKGRQEQDDDP